MMTAGIETLGLALIGGTEIDAIVGGPGQPGQPGQPAPLIMTILHSPGDSLDKIRADDMATAFPVLQRALRLLDQQALTG